MATYGPGIYQSQHVKSLSHIINENIFCRWFKIILRLSILKFLTLTRTVQIYDEIWSSSGLLLRGIDVILIKLIQ